MMAKFFTYPGKVNMMVILCLIHTMFILLMYILLSHLGMISFKPTNTNVVRWDVFFHQSIKDYGYIYVPRSTCNLAFFPLFPILWKILNLSPLIMCLFNYVLFLFSFTILLHKEKLHPGIVLFLLSIPSFIFFALPYSESLFFLFAALLLKGYKEQSTFYIVIALFCVSMVKSVSVIIIPAILIVELMTYSKNKPWFYGLLLKLSATVSGLMLSVLIQVYQTGKWFYFIEVQQYWNRHWIVPGFPLTTISPERILALDGIAFIIGIMAIAYCLHQAYLYGNAFLIKKNWTEKHPEVLFSALFLSGTVILDTIFTYNVDGAGNLWSMNRHLLCTPFFVVFIVFFLTNPVQHLWIKICLFVTLTSGLYITGVFNYPRMAAYYFVFMLSLIVIKLFPRSYYYLIPVYGGNMILQLFFFQSFTENLWIG